MKIHRTCVRVLTALACLSAPAFAAGLPGSYSVSGSNPDGTRYSTSLEVSRSTDTYRFVWGAETVGVGVVVGDQVAVAYGSAACGVVAYTVGKNGDLDGV